jgi:hypothetical protein
MRKGSHNKGAQRKSWLVMENLCSWSENNKQIVLIFRSEPLYLSLYCRNHMLNHNNLFMVIDNFQRYIHLDKSIVLNKEI